MRFVKPQGIEKLITALHHIAVKKSRAFIPFHHAERIVYALRPFPYILFGKTACEFKIFQTVGRRHHYDLAYVGCKRKSPCFQIGKRNVFVFYPFLEFGSKRARLKKLVSKKQHMLVRVAVFKHALVQKALAVPNIVGDFRLLLLGYKFPVL